MEWRMVGMRPVVSSSIRAIGYDAAAKELWIEYRSAAAAYVYVGVPARVFAEFAKAPSKGRYVNLFVKPRFAARRRRPPRGAARKRKPARRR